MDEGILFIATGETYVNELEKALESIEKLEKDYNVAVVSDKEIEFDIEKTIKIEGPEYDFLDKIEYMKESPFEKTLFLDTDTFVYKEIDEVFELLDSYDLAAAHAPGRGSTELKSIPKSFPEYNTGVIAFRGSEKVKKFLENWKNLYNKKDWVNDQPAFRKLLYESNLLHTTLTPEYNCRFVFPTFVSGDVKIFHGRMNKNFEIKDPVKWRENIYDFMERVDKKRNRLQMRLIIPRFSKIKIHDGGMFSTQRVLADALKEGEYDWIIDEVKHKLRIGSKPKNYKNDEM